MSGKKKGGKKKVFSLAEFEQRVAPGRRGRDDVLLPSAPKGADVWEREKQERFGRFDNRDERDPDEPSRADEADVWRRQGPVAAAPAAESFGRADDVDEWRRGRRDDFDDRGGPRDDRGPREEPDWGALRSSDRRPPPVERRDYDDRGPRDDRDWGALRSDDRRPPPVERRDDYDDRGPRDEPDWGALRSEDRHPPPVERRDDDRGPRDEPDWGALRSEDRRPPPVERRDDYDDRGPREDRDWGALRASDRRPPPVERRDDYDDRGPRDERDWDALRSSERRAPPVERRDDYDSRGPPREDRDWGALRSSDRRPPAPQQRPPPRRFDDRWGPRREQQPAPAGGERRWARQEGRRDATPEKEKQEAEDRERRPSPPGRQARHEDRASEGRENAAVATAAANSTATEAKAEVREPEKPATEPEKPAAEPKKPKPRPKPKNVKKIDPNAKLDPFGGARAKEPEKKLAPKPLREIVREKDESAAPSGGAKYRPPVDPFGGASRHHDQLQQQQQQQGQQDAELAVVEQSEWEKALESKCAVSLETLMTELGALDDKQVNMPVVAEVIAQSFAEGNFTLADVRPVLERSTIMKRLLVASLEATLALKDEEFVSELLGDADAVELLGEDPPKALLFLVGVKDVKPALVKALGENLPPERIIEVVRTASEGKFDSADLSSDVAAHVFEAVYASQDADLDKLRSFEELLRFIVDGNEEAMVNVILGAHIAWSKNGMKKGEIRKSFEVLLESGIVSSKAFVVWKSDLSTKKTPGKQKALIQVFAFLKKAEEAARKPMTAAQESDDDEEIDIDAIAPSDKPRDEWLF